jgi:hypothetical protein
VTWGFHGPGAPDGFRPRLRIDRAANCLFRGPGGPERARGLRPFLGMFLRYPETRPCLNWGECYARALDALSEPGELDALFDWGPLRD